MSSILSSVINNTAGKRPITRKPSGSTTHCKNVQLYLTFRVNIYQWQFWQSSRIDQLVWTEFCAKWFYRTDDIHQIDPFVKLGFRPNGFFGQSAFYSNDMHSQKLVSPSRAVILTRNIKPAPIFFSGCSAFRVNDQFGQLGSRLNLLSIKRLFRPNDLMAFG